MDKSLKQEFKKLIDALPGSNERTQISSLLEVATEFNISNDTTCYLSDIMTQSAFQVEHNLDFASLPYPTMWIEWSEKVRNKTSIIDDKKIQPESIGVLLCEHPSDVGSVLGMVCWRSESGIVDHSHALISWNKKALDALAFDARRFYSKVNSEVIKRILSTANTYIPDGFIEEINILKDDDISTPSLDEYNHLARIDSSVEVPFIFSILILLNSPNVILKQDSNSIISKFMVEHSTKKRKKVFFEKFGFNRKSVKNFIELHLKN